MIRNWFKNLKSDDAHPAEEMLLACIDGELSEKEAARIRKHLENCWSCRAQLDAIEETITSFVNFRAQIQNPLAAPPPGNWNNFNRKLAEAAAEIETEKVSASSRLSFRHRFLQAASFGDWSPVRKQFGIGTVAAVLIFALLFQLASVPNVSAAELLENSIRFQKQNIGQVSQPVVYQKLRLTRADGKAVDWETWQDKTNARYRQALAGERSGRRFINAEFNPNKNDLPDEPVLREIAQILQANRMNPQQPLSAESFQSWRNSLAEKSDQVENSRVPSGKQIFTLKTVSNGAADAGKIIEAALTVRASDWHAERLRLSVKSETGATDYEFVETAFEVVALPALSAEIFPGESLQSAPPAKTEIAAAAPDAKPSPAVSPSAEIENDANANLPVQPSPSASTSLAPPIAAATAELEVDVLKALNGIGADIGEEATVTRNAAGGLLVQGVVESRERKAEINRALAPLVGQPGLSVRIETSEEAQKRVVRERTQAAAKNKSNQENNNEGVSVEPLEFRNTIPADTEVRRYLRSKGAAENVLNDEVNRFATQTINRSNQVLLRALALKNLAGRFSDAQLRSMKPEARNQWLNLIAARASEIESQNHALRQEIAAVFGAISNGESVDASDEAGLKRAVLRLSELAAGNDRAVRAAFTFSSGANSDAVKGAQFRQSLGSIEGLANGIESAARRLQSK